MSDRTAELFERAKESGKSAEEAWEWMQENSQNWDWDPENMPDIAELIDDE